VAGVLRALQGGIEAMYRVETDLDVCDFLVGADRGGWETQRSPSEQLLIRVDNDAVELGLFVDEKTLENLELRDPRRKLDDSNLHDFLLAVEGVSHFVYVAHRARHERPVSAVELELQAEVDKFLVALLVSWNQTGGPPDTEALRERLFERIAFADDLSPEERERYELANRAAAMYAAALEARFLRDRVDVDELLAEARRFYRRGLADKLDIVHRLAA
jgi:hypothetical protein